MTTYTVHLVNQTPNVWTFVIALTLPNGSGLESVAWKLKPVPGTNGTGTLTWTDSDFCAAIGTRTTSGATIVYEQNQSLAATAGSAWSIVLQSSVQSLQRGGDSILPGTIQIANTSGSLASAAFGIASQAAVYDGALLSGASAFFDPEPQYQVLLADSMEQGQVLNLAPPLNLTFVAGTTLIVGPKPLPLTPASPSWSVTASSTAGAIALTVAAA